MFCECLFICADAHFFDVVQATFSKLFHVASISMSPVAFVI